MCGEIVMIAGAQSIHCGPIRRPAQIGHHSMTAAIGRLPGAAYPRLERAVES